MRMVVGIAAILFTTAALAQEPSTDRYWQQLIAGKEAQSAQQIVDLAKRLDAAQAQIAKLQKQIDDAAKPKSSEPAKAQ